MAWSRAKGGWVSREPVLLEELLKQALKRRSAFSSEALRLWFGPGEARTPSARPLAAWAVDGYGRWLWVTEWELKSGPVLETRELARITRLAFEPAGYLGAVILRRPRQGVPALPELLWGSVPEDRFEVGQGPLRFWIQLLGSRHPGLFLDHEPLRQWLVSGGECRGKKVLNTFAYTGSLSVAAWVGGAAHVDTLDLSKATLAWARQNIELNGGGSNAEFYAGDFFELLPQFIRQGRKYGVVISDPPSFSRSKRGNFSTQKDLVKLHELL
ncbi:MAG: class I SAM-dependent methyltransferase, partial [Oligoflexia bacterium]